VKTSDDESISGGSMETQKQVAIDYKMLGDHLQKKLPQHIHLKTTECQQRLESWPFIERVLFIERLT
jgi:hypothetical protein